jgi:hypothetical protein
LIVVAEIIDPVDVIGMNVRDKDGGNRHKLRAKRVQPEIRANVDHNIVIRIHFEERAAAGAGVVRIGRGAAGTGAANARDALAGARAEDFQYGVNRTIHVE